MDDDLDELAAHLRDAGDLAGDDLEAMEALRQRGQGRQCDGTCDTCPDLCWIENQMTPEYDDSDKEGERHGG